MDIRDLMLEAQAEVQGIMREVVQELVKPQMMKKVRDMWRTAPEEIRESFKRERPKEYMALMNDLKRR